jgi:hypothetical protein
MDFAAASWPSMLLSFRSWREIVIAAGFLAIALAILTCREKLRKYRTRNWPTTPGTVVNIHSRKVDGGSNGIDYWKFTFDYNYGVTQQRTGTYAFNCTSENMVQGATAGLENKTVTVHYKPSDESKGILWEDEIWDIWWDTYWTMTHPEPETTAQ